MMLHLTCRCLLSCEPQRKAMSDKVYRNIYLQTLLGSSHVTSWRYNVFHKNAKDFGTPCLVYIIFVCGSSHCLNQCWVIVNWTLMNKLQWNFNQNTKLFIHENASQNTVCEMVTILSKERWVNVHRIWCRFKWSQSISQPFKGLLCWYFFISLKSQQCVYMSKMTKICEFIGFAWGRPLKMTSYKWHAFPSPSMHVACSKVSL